MPTRETNWAGNYAYSAERLVHPRSVAELGEVVAGARRVRALGSRHSFSDLADTEGTLVALLDLPADVEIDADRALVRVAGGVTYGALSTALHAAGWALPSMASLPHITVAGAVATGTHGSGVGIGSLASIVRSVELIGPDGQLRTVARGDPSYDGHVVALGALGIVTHLTLAIEPTFEVRQDVYLGVEWDHLFGDLDAILASAYSVSVFTDWRDPGATQVWLKSRSAAQPDAAALGRSRLATAATHMLMGGALESLTAQLGEVGPWHERLPHFRMEFTPSWGAELQSEYFVPRRHAAAAGAALRELGSVLATVLQICEIRTIAADPLWLSGAHGEDVVAFHFTWRLEPERVEAVLRRIEAALAPYDARPHWGKVFTMDPARLAEVYPRLRDFAELRARTDPEGRFDNAFLRRHLPA